MAHDDVLHEFEAATGDAPETEDDVLHEFEAATGDAPETEVEPAPDDNTEVEPAPDDNTEIARLAKLDPLTYDRERQPASKKLGVSVSALDVAVKAKRKTHGGDESAARRGRPTMANDDVLREFEAAIGDAPETEAKPALDDAAAEREIQRLARLSRLRYARERIEAARSIKIGVGELDRLVRAARAEQEPNDGADLPDLEPWPDPVDGPAVAAEMAATFKRHLAMPEGADVAMTLWALHAHALDASGISPILAVTSPTPECGKTTALALVGAMVPRPLPASNITGAAVFRAVERWQPTLIIDEADTFLRDDDALRGILNSAHFRAQAYTVRTIGDDHVPKRFSTWCAKAIALIGRLHPTLAGRSIAVEMRRLGAGEQIESLRWDRLEAYKPLARKAARWAIDNLEELRMAEPEPAAGCRGRVADNWHPLLAIADHLGGVWPQAARKLASRLGTRARDDATFGEMLLADIRLIFDAAGVDRLASTDMAERLARMEHRPWPEFRSGKPMTPRQIARLLAPFGIAPVTIRTATRTSKGYRRDQFEEAWRRYLSEDPPCDPQHRHIPQDSAVSGHDPSVTGEGDVTDGKTSKRRDSAACDGVTDEIPLDWEDDAEERIAIQEGGNRARPESPDEAAAAEMDRNLYPQHPQDPQSEENQELARGENRGDAGTARGTAGNSESLSPAGKPEETQGVKPSAGNAGNEYTPSLVKGHWEEDGQL